MLAVILVLAHLLLAQLTLVLAAVLYVIGRVSRWRWQWLAAPAVAGLLWTLAIGPSRAVAGLTAGPRQVLAYLTGIGRYPGRLLHLQDAYAGMTHWLPEQFPLALILAAAEALGLCWLQRRRGDGRGWRPGLIVAARRRWTAASLRSGGVVTRDGCCLGLDVATGRRAAISWAEAEGGVLCAGSAAGVGMAAGAGLAADAGLAAETGLAAGAESTGAAGPAAGASSAGPDRLGGPDRSGGAVLIESGFTLAHAAIRRRKPLIVIDLTGSEWLAEALAAACVEPGAPLSRFGQAGTGYYEPLRGGDPARAAALVMGMIDWSDVGDRQRRSCAAYLTDALAVQAAAPFDRRVPALDDLLRLLTPDGLRERATLIPAYHPRRDVLTDRAAVSAGLLQADPATVASPTVQLPRLRASALGHWLQPVAPGAARISLGQTVRERGVTLFSLDRDVHGRSARMIAGLAVADLKAVCTELQEMSVPGDSLIWINGCEVLGQRVLSDLVAQGRGAGMAVMLSTMSAAAADDLAAVVNVLVARGPVDPALAGRFAGVAGTGTAPGPTATPDTMTAGRMGAAADLAFGMNGGGPFSAEVRPVGIDAFALLAARPQGRVLPQCRHVPARAAGRPQ